MVIDIGKYKMYTASGYENKQGDDKMAENKPIKESREYFVFDTFFTQADFKSVYAAFENYDKTHKPGIIPQSNGKKSIKNAYDICKKVLHASEKSGQKVDLDDADVLKDMFGSIKKKFNKVCSCPFVDLNNKISGAGTVKFFIGGMICQFSDYVSQGLGKVQEDKHRAQQATTAKHGHIGFSYDNGQVFSDKKTYKKRHGVILKKSDVKEL